MIKHKNPIRTSRSSQSILTSCFQHLEYAKPLFSDTWSPCRHDDRPCPRAWVGRPNLARVRVPHSRTRAHRTTAMSAIFTTSMSAKASAKVRLASASPRAHRSRVYPRAHPRRERTSSEPRARRPRTRDARASSIAARAVKRNTHSRPSRRLARVVDDECTHAYIHPSIHPSDRSDASRGLNRNEWVTDCVRNDKNSRFNSALARPRRSRLARWRAPPCDSPSTRRRCVRTMR